MHARLSWLLCLLALAACAPATPIDPTADPTAVSTSAPTAVPTAAPTAPPVASPTIAATAAPTASPAPAPAAQQAFFIGNDRRVRAASQTNRTIAALGELPPDANALWLAPGGGAVAFVSDGRLTVQVLATGKRYPLTPAGVGIDINGMGVALANNGTPGNTEVATTTALLGGLSWSPDGNTLLFSTDNSDDFFQNPQPQLYLATLDGAPLRVLGPGLAPSWSPAGDRIAYLGPPFLGSPPFGGGPGGHPMLANADGSNARPVGEAQDVYGAWQPLVWSRDGARLGVGTQLVDATSGAVVARAPANDHIMIDGIQQVSPDGQSFLYWRNQRFNDSSAAGFHELDELLLVFANGAVRPIIRRAPNECPCLPIGGQINGVWSPTGSRFALADSELGLRLFTSDGTPIGRLHLPQGAQPLGDVGWSDDEQRLLLSLSVDKRPETWLLDTRGQLPRRLGEGVALGWGS